MFDITALGEVLIDMTYNGKNEDGRTLFAQNPGGAPANLLVAATKLGCKTAILGKAGVDMHGEFLKETLEENAVETKGFILDEKYFTTLAFVNLSSSGERSFSFARKPGADTQLEVSDLYMDAVQQTKVFHIGSLSLTDEPARGTTHYAIQEAKKAGAIISYDPNYRGSLWTSEEAAKQQMRSLVSYVDVMKISDEETALLTDAPEPEKAAAVLLSQGVKLVAVTLGGNGVLIASKAGCVHVPGFTVPVADTTGAGDSFWGGFLNRLILSGKKPEELTLEEMQAFERFANAVAGCCVQKKGAIPAMPTMEMVEELLNL